MAEENNKKRVALNGGFLALIGVGLNILIVIVNLVASSNYTARSDFNALNVEFDKYRRENDAALATIRQKETESLGTIANGITELNGKMQDNVRQDSMLKDHEERIRADHERLLELDGKKR